MDRSDRDRPALAPAYELTLELESAGLADDDIAERLGVPRQSLPSLLALAHAKAHPTPEEGPQCSAAS